MYVNNLDQLINFIYFIIVGMILSIVFDMFRILRRAFKTTDIVTNIEDLMFGIVTGGILLLSIFLFNNGELRFYIFIGITIGIIIYMLFFSKFFINFNMIMINLIKKIIAIIVKPFKILYKFTKKLFFRPISFIINLKLLNSKLLIKLKNNTKIYKKHTNQEGF